MVLVLRCKVLVLGLNTRLDLRLGLERILKSWSYVEINLLVSILVLKKAFITSLSYLGLRAAAGDFMVLSNAQCMFDEHCKKNIKCGATLNEIKTRI